MLKVNDPPDLSSRCLKREISVPPHYDRRVDERMKSRGVSRSEAYRQYQDEADGRNAYRWEVRNLADQIRTRAEGIAKRFGADAIAEMAEIIRAAERIKSLT
jgi:regulator of protease activity HflC (stomatin/prohibitin superfamily)